jgi:hypothetical protein
VSRALAIVLAAAIAAVASASASASEVQADPASLQAEGAFCTDAPTSVDARVASAVNALGVFAPTTPPIAILDTGTTDVSELSADRLVTPFDALSGSEDGSDLDGHGTQVAALAAGRPGLVEGVSPTSPIMPVRIYNRQAQTAPQALTAGIAWAVSHGAAVINISSSTPASDVSEADTNALVRAVSDAFNAGVLVVASAGNEGTAVQEIPASLPHVLDVGASDFNDRRATFSNPGPWVDLVAPAASLAGPMPIAYCPSGYAVANGTSFAAPAASAGVALLAQLRPELSAQQRFDVLRSSARDLDPAGRDDETGFGMLNVGAAVSAAVPAKESSPEVDDDPFYVRGPFAAQHPTMLTKTKNGKAKIRIAGQVSAAKDPSDVYPVKLRKGERLVASATASGADSVLFLGLWKPAVGDFDVSREITKQQIVTSGGFSATPELKMRVTKSGTYYVSVEAPDVIDEDDPEAVVPVAQSYQLSLSKSPVPKRKPSPKKKSSTKKRSRSG